MKRKKKNGDKMLDGVIQKGLKMIERVEKAKRRSAEKWIRSSNPSKLEMQTAMAIGSVSWPFHITKEDEKCAEELGKQIEKFRGEEKEAVEKRVKTLKEFGFVNFQNELSNKLGKVYAGKRGWKQYTVRHELDKVWVMPVPEQEYEDKVQELLNVAYEYEKDEEKAKKALDKLQHMEEDVPGAKPIVKIIYPDGKEGVPSYYLWEEVVGRDANGMPIWEERTADISSLQPITVMAMEDSPDWKEIVSECADKYRVNVKFA